MKKLRIRYRFVAILTLFIFLFAGCKQIVSPEISDRYEEIITIGDESLQEEVVANEGEEEQPLPAQENANDPLESEQSAEAATEPVYRPPANDLEPYPAACATTAVRVRRGAGTGYGVLFTLTGGDSLPYLWKEGEWLAVWTGERVGYLYAAYAYLTQTNEAIERTIRAGLDRLGTPYEWGAPRILNEKGSRNPYFTGKSFDCSSFVQYCYYVGMGIKLGNYTGSQADYTVGKKIQNYDDLKRGDFYFTGYGTISHVAIYLGGGMLLQAYSANGGPVSVTSDEKWKSKFLSGRRPDPTVIEQFR